MSVFLAIAASEGGLETVANGLDRYPGILRPQKGQPRAFLLRFSSHGGCIRTRGMADLFVRSAYVLPDPIAGNGHTMGDQSGLLHHQQSGKLGSHRSMARPAESRRRRLFADAVRLAVYHKA